MIEHLANIIVDSMSKNKIIVSEDREEYLYGINIFISSALHLITLFIIIMIMGLYWQGILFNFAYIMLRNYAGGFHAKSSKVCYLISIGICITSLAVIKFFEASSGVIYILSLFSYIVLMLFSPVEDRNKPLDEIETKVFKVRARIMASIYLLLIIIFCLNGLPEIAFVITLSISILSFMVILGVIKNKIINIKEKDVD